MLTRALIVLLLILNLGVAAWWLLKPATAVNDMPLQPAGIPQLQLVPASTPAQAATVASPAAPASNVAEPAQSPVVEPAPQPAAAATQTKAAPARALCVNLGPYLQQAQAEQARQRLSAANQRVSVREVPGAGARQYRVLLPAQADKATAQALVEKIGQAGFKDYLLIGAGSEANSIALGVYGSRDSALKRQTALQAAGFDAQIVANGENNPSEWWLDLRTDAAINVEQLKTTAAAASALQQACVLG